MKMIMMMMTNDDDNNHDDDNGKNKKKKIQNFIGLRLHIQHINTYITAH